MSEEARAQEEREEIERLVQQALHFGGMSTAPEVKKLRERYPADMLQPGFIVRYDDISAIIGVKYGTNRWKTVVRAWRDKIEAEDNIVFEAMQGWKQFKVQSPEDRLRTGIQTWKPVARKLKRQSFRVARVKFEDAALVATSGHVLRYNSILVNQIQAGRKALPGPPSANKPTQRA